MTNLVDSNTIYFALGSFHFTYKKKPTYLFKLGDYLNDLEKLLQEIPSISNISISIDKENNNYKPIHIDKPVPKYSDGNGFFPYLNYCTISFEINISKRMQQAISDSRHSHAHPLPVENFKITIDYGYNCPVAIIEAINPPNEYVDISEAVVLIREFLITEIGKIKKNYIELEVLGPSPMHVEFILKRGSSKDKELTNRYFNTKTLSSIGYTRLLINYNGAVFKTIEKAKQRIFYILFLEADFYYHFCSIRAGLIHEWSDIQDKLYTFINNQKQNGIKGFINKLWNNQNDINRLLISLSGFEQEKMSADDSIFEQKTSVFKKTEGNIIEDLCEADIKNMYHFPVNSIKSLIDSFNFQQANRYMGIITIVATIFGGIIGALITKALT